MEKILQIELKVCVEKVETHPHSIGTFLMINNKTPIKGTHKISTNTFLKTKFAALLYNMFEIKISCNFFRLQAIVTGLFPKVLEKFDLLRKYLLVGRDDGDEEEKDVTLEILHVRKEFSETFSIFYQPRCQPVVKPLLRKSAVAKLNKFYIDLHDILGESFSIHLNLNAARNSNSELLSQTLTSSCSTSNHSNSNNNNTLQLKLPSNKKSQDVESNSIVAVVPMSVDQKTSNNLSKSFLKRSQEVCNTSSVKSSLGHITLNSKWCKSFVKSGNILSPLLSSEKMVGTGTAVNGKLNKRSRGIHKSFVGRYKNRNRLLYQKVFLTLPL